jgi:hypothetical protein
MRSKHSGRAVETKLSSSTLTRDWPNRPAKRSPVFGDKLPHLIFRQIASLLQPEAPDQGRFKPAVGCAHETARISRALPALDRRVPLHLPHYREPAQPARALGSGAAVADGRPLKCPSSVISWPIRADPTTLLSRSTRLPCALSGKMRLAMPVTANG